MFEEMSFLMINSFEEKVILRDNNFEEKSFFIRNSFEERTILSCEIDTKMARALVQAEAGEGQESDEFFKSLKRELVDLYVK